MENLKLGDKVRFSKEVIRKNYSHICNDSYSRTIEAYGKGNLSSAFIRYTHISHKEPTTGIICGIRTIKYAGYTYYDDGYGFLPLEHKRVYLVAAGMNRFYKVLVEDVEAVTE